MQNKLRRKLAGVGAFFVLLSFRVWRPKELKYEILDSGEAYASYSGGLIYIGRSEYHHYSLEDGDIFILDSRWDANPDMKIFNSYKVLDSCERSEVLSVLCEYEKNNPSEWDRSLESMELEWTLHNLGYYFNVKRDSSADVDLDNSDEEIYNNKVLQKALK